VNSQQIMKGVHKMKSFHDLSILYYRNDNSCIWNTRSMLKNVHMKF